MSHIRTQDLVTVCSLTQEMTHRKYFDIAQHLFSIAFENEVERRTLEALRELGQKLVKSSWLPQLQSKLEKVCVSGEN